jgi:hypothetical protein
MIQKSLVARNARWQGLLYYKKNRGRLVLVRFDHLAPFIVNANHRIIRPAENLA